MRWGHAEPRAAGAGIKLTPTLSRLRRITGAGAGVGVRTKTRACPHKNQRNISRNQALLRYHTFDFYKIKNFILKVSCKISTVFVVMCWQPPAEAADNWILFMTLSSVNIRRISALLAAGCAKRKDKTYKQEDKSVFSNNDLKSQHFREMFRKKPHLLYKMDSQEIFLSFDHWTHIKPEIWLTRRYVPGIFWADSRENGHVSDEWFLDWNELDWSRGSIVTPILRAHFPDHQSTRHKMSKISNVLHTPHYL